MRALLAAVALVLVTATPAYASPGVTWQDECDATTLLVTVQQPTTLLASGRHPVVLYPDQRYADRWGSDYGTVIIQVGEQVDSHLWQRPTGCSTPAPEREEPSIPGWAWRWALAGLAAAALIAAGMVANAVRTRPTTEPEGTDQ